jgi:hypothetical protein
MGGGQLPTQLPLLQEKPAGKHDACRRDRPGSEIPTRPRPFGRRSLFRANALPQNAFHASGRLAGRGCRRNGHDDEVRLKESVLAFFAAGLQMGSHGLLNSLVKAPQRKQLPVSFNVSAVHAHSILTFP